MNKLLRPLLTKNSPLNREAHIKTLEDIEDTKELHNDIMLYLEFATDTQINLYTKIASDLRINLIKYSECNTDLMFTLIKYMKDNTDLRIHLLDYILIATDLRFNLIQKSEIQKYKKADSPVESKHAFFSPESLTNLLNKLFPDYSEKKITQ